MATIEQNWNITFNWWEWDWFYNWPSWSYRAGSNLETKQLENWAMICNWLISTDNTYIWEIIAINWYEDKTFCTDDKVWHFWKIYYNWAFTFNLWTGSQDRVYWFWKMTRLADNINYSYWFSWVSSWVWKIYRFANDFLSKSNIWTRTLWKGRLTIWNKIITLWNNWRIIFATANTIFEITRQETITTLLELPKEADIIEITNYQDTYKIYFNLTRFPNWTTDSFIASWDWFDNVYSNYVQYEASPIRMVVNDWPYDYVSFWDNFTTDLYYVWWINRWKPIRTNIEESINNTRIFWTEWVIREWVLYMNWENKLWEKCLYSFWNYYPWSKSQLVPENKWKEINKLNVSERVIYCYINNDVSANVWKIYSRSLFFATQPESTATIYTYALTWNYWISTEKTINRVYVSYLLFHQSDHIKIYCRNNWWPYTENSSWWVLIKDITWTSYLSKRWCTINRNEIPTIWDFYQLEYKIELISWRTKSPILWNIKTDYTDNIKQ